MAAKSCDGNKCDRNGPQGHIRAHSFPPRAMSGKVKYFHKRKCVCVIAALCLYSVSIFRRKASNDIVIGASKTSTKKRAVKKEGNAIFREYGQWGTKTQNGNAEICPQFTPLADWPI